jgi:putative transposase
MSRLARASHVLWHCQYHVVWVPKYRYRVWKGPVEKEVYRSVMILCQQLGCEVVELNVQVPPKLSVSDLLGVLKGRTAIRLFSAFPQLRKKPYWGNPFWAKGYCVDTVGLDGEMIRKYVKYQERQEQHQRQLELRGRGEPS